MKDTPSPDRRSRRLFAAQSEQVPNGAYIKCKVLYAERPDSVIVFRLAGVVRAYLNRCVHMPRELDCEANTVFSGNGSQLRCSMHGIVYDPEDGRSLSTLCFGKRLTPVSVVEEDAAIWITDKRVRPWPGAPLLASGTTPRD
jgi:nitrite reductase/ring-hydroxylating ferredoxin subunit